jgi:predicted membrane protein
VPIGTATGGATHYDGRMPLLDIVIALVIVGVILWLINRFIPMASSIKTILNLVVVIAVIWWLLSILGFVEPLSSIRVG